MNKYDPVTAPIQRVPLRVQDVRLLHDRGAFDGYGKVELVEGDLLYVNAQYRPHMVLKGRIAYRLQRALEDIGSTLFTGTEGSVALSMHDLPQPDIILTSAPDGDGPVPGASVALLVEIADATLTFDLSRKQYVYADAGVPEYWVADVNGRVIHQFWSPVDGVYADRRTVAFGERLTSATIPDLAITTDGL